jgi:tripartite-type tricarboxylate transporter receptor subunit TctC
MRDLRGRRKMMNGLLRAVLAFGAALACAGAGAQTGGKPVHFLVGYPPGGGTDFTARLVAPLLAERLGQPVIVENRVGAAGNIAMEAVAKAEPDGLTIGLGVSGMTINATLQPELRFHPLKDFAPVTRLVNNPLVMVANPSFPAKDVRTVIRMAKERPGALNYGTPGAGTGMHMMGELLKTEADVNLVHVPYKGNGPLVNDLLGDHISLGIADLASTRTFIKEGRLRALAVGAPARTELAPEIPTVAESGLPGFSVLSWTGVIAPAGTPAATVEAYNRHIRAILETADVRAKLLAAGLEPAPTTVEQFREIIRSDIGKWAKVIKAAGIKLER